MPDREIEQLPDEIPAKEVHRILLPFLNRQEAIQMLRSDRELEEAANEGEEEELTEAEQQIRQQELVQELDQEFQAVQEEVDTLEIDLEDPETDRIEHEHLDEFTETASFKQAMVDLPDNPVLQQLLEAGQAEQVQDSELEEASPTDTLPAWLSDDGIDFDAIPEDEMQEYDIVRFPISHLVAMQKTVTTDAYEDLPTDEDEFDELLEYCLPTGGSSFRYGSMIETAGNEFSGYQVISRDPNVGSTMQIRNRPDGAFKITFVIGGSPNFVQVKHFEDRYVLKNGYHRVVKLLEAGHTHVPAVVTEAEEWSEVTQDQSHFGPRTVRQDRPPMVSDFLADWTKTVQRPATNKVVRVIQETTNIPR